MPTETKRTLSRTTKLYCPYCRRAVTDFGECSTCGGWRCDNLESLVKMYRPNTRARYTNSYYEHNKDRFAKYAEERRQTKWYCIDCNKTIQMASRGRHLASPYHHNRLKVNIDHQTAPTSPSPSPPRKRIVVVRKAASCTLPTPPSTATLGILDRHTSA